LGVEIGFTEKDNFPPLRIVGSDVKGGTVDVDASSSSQFVTALMLIAPYLEQGMEIRLTKKTVSFSYIEMTQKLMREFGVAVEISENKIWVNPGEYQMKPYPFEPDWSSASYWYQMVALSDKAEVALPGFEKESVQGDRACAEIFDPLGVKTEFTGEGIVLRRKDAATGELTFDFTGSPDLVPAVMATCAAKKVQATFKGISHLRYKESDRVESLTRELAKVGVKFRISDDTVEMIPGEEMTKTGAVTFETYNDHRLAMAETGVRRGCFDGMSHGVAVVERSADAGFPFVRRDHGGFDPDIAGDEPVQLFRSRLQDI
jgi:3-phosphoshikimate 1-carboxyvinyltransferase